MLFAVALLLAIFWLPGPIGWTIVGLAFLAELGEAWFWYRWSQRRRTHVGAETLVGRHATVVVACRPGGQVKLDGEHWQAVCADGAEVGDRVEIEAVDGLTLQVRRA